MFQTDGVNGYLRQPVYVILGIAAKYERLLKAHKIYSIVHIHSVAAGTLGWCFVDRPGCVRGDRGQIRTRGGFKLEMIFVEIACVIPAVCTVDVHAFSLLSASPTQDLRLFHRLLSEDIGRLLPQGAIFCRSVPGVVDTLVHCPNLERRRARLT